MIIGFKQIIKFIFIGGALLSIGMIFKKRPIYKKDFNTYILTLNSKDSSVSKEPLEFKKVETVIWPKDKYDDFTIKNKVFTNMNFTFQTSFDRVEFANCIFQNFDFSQASFNDVIFKNCVFNEVKIGNNTRFSNSQFIHLKVSNSILINEDSTCDSCLTFKQVLFDNALFEDNSFKGVFFQDSSRFVNTIFSKNQFTRSHFKNCEFKDVVYKKNMFTLPLKEHLDKKMTNKDRGVSISDSRFDNVKIENQLTSVINFDSVYHKHNLQLENITINGSFRFIPKRNRHYGKWESFVNYDGGIYCNLEKIYSGVMFSNINGMNISNFKGGDLSVFSVENATKSTISNVTTGVASFNFQAADSLTFENVKITRKSEFGTFNIANSTFKNIHLGGRLKWSNVRFKNIKWENVTIDEGLVHFEFKNIEWDTRPYFLPKNIIIEYDLTALPPEEKRIVKKILNKTIQVNDSAVYTLPKWARIKLSRKLNTNYLLPTEFDWPNVSVISRRHKITSKGVLKPGPRMVSLMAEKTKDPLDKASYEIESWSATLVRNNTAVSNTKYFWTKLGNLSYFSSLMKPGDIIRINTKSMTRITPLGEKKLIETDVIFDILIN